MVIHKMRRNKDIQVCKLRKPEADTIMNDKAITKQRYTHTVKPEYDNRDKGISGLPGE